MHSAPGPGRSSPTQWFLVRNTAAAEPPHFSGSPLIKHYSLAPLDFKATSGINLSGTVTNMQGQGISGAIVSCQAPNLDGLYLSITTSSTGSYAIVAPLNRPVDLSLSVPSLYIAPAAVKGIIFSGDAWLPRVSNQQWRIFGPK